MIMSPVVRILKILILTAPVLFMIIGTIITMTTVQVGDYEWKMIEEGWVVLLAGATLFLTLLRGESSAMDATRAAAFTIYYVIPLFRGVELINLN